MVACSGRWSVAVMLVPLAIGAAACGDSSPVTPDPDPPADTIPAVRFTQVAAGLERPVDLNAPAGDTRIFIVEQPGRIRVLRNNQIQTAPFLDISDQVRSGGEQGLLGLTFHPEYASNGLFFVHYTDRAGDSRVVRYSVSTEADVADPTSAVPVLTVAQPQSNHNGGQIAFGPDGMLYIALGDGGGGGDPGNHGQNPATLLGSLLRLDVDGTAPYAIPADNPFTDGGGRPEVWAYGLRNPWRFSFDHERALLFIADVGQNRREEINVQPAAAAALNYGWNRMEGTECYPATAACNPAGLVLPVLEYPNPADGCSVTGGYVYRGSAIPALRGYYLYADYCRGWVRAFRLADDGVTTPRELAPGLGNVTSFGQDAAGELYVLTASGVVHRIDPP